MSKKNIFYAQSGGATAVINATACGVIQTAEKYPLQINKVLAGRNGIIGALKEELIDTSLESSENIAALLHTPSSAFGSCRYKLADINKDRRQYERLIEVFKAHDIGYVFYNGGGDSQDTTYKISQMSQLMDYPLICIGLPKTIDNDLPFTDNCPGFGSVAKYVAVSTKEAALDVRGMAATSTKVFILEVMGRHAGWIAATAALSQQYPNDAPHIILFPEIPLQTEAFLTKVKGVVHNYGYCVIVASEGIRYPDGRFITESAGSQDTFGHEQLGGVAPILARLIKRHLGFKYHWAVADYLQRAARHIASQTDLDQAYVLGQSAVEYALVGQSDVMLTIQREESPDYQWHVGTAPLSQVANVEHKLPRNFIANDGFGITKPCRRYLEPLIQGESYPPYKNGVPVYVKLKNQLVEKKLKEAFAL
ncbi:6-phosphofructokinase [Candidatus Coxiella mudrowiae]|uniref:Pyrophosphate--fructose 6-phosphate 1-phosphotransferase n=1 Tax=Candidatus Coxiella mudrowiae TaxID=2054173 RepID=A0ABN4HQ13_9COXI|nr:6-phosphofructokinase [Candidatus Coxiella mudrowiae]AKQ33802.1 Pyrophosphate--fructose 6-phosphate 1-phosphotransferase [Candidatus Coxiella mudrowiae]WQM43429.1 pyrophosphate--fructose 6-phosphate 1-phosphotransferase [Candidatus Coxiella mudrowiae]